jgi:flagellar motor switch protein FliM
LAGHSDITADNAAGSLKEIAAEVAALSARCDHSGQMNPPQWANALVALRQRIAGPILPAWAAGPVELHLRARALLRSCYAQFRREVVEPTCCYLLSASPAGEASAPLTTSAGQCLWLELSPRIAYPVLDMLLGGSGRAAVIDGRALTTLERRLLQRLVDALAQRLSLAWPDRPIACATVSDAHAAANMRHLAGDEPAAVLELELSAGVFSGTLRLCMPAALLEAMLPPGQPSAATSDGPLEVSATVADISLPGPDVAALCPGDILITETPSDGDVVVRLAGIPKYTARLGASNGRRAVTITGPVKPPTKDGP